MKKTKKIIIEFEKDISEATAVEHVLNSVNGGRISKAKHGDHFCWLTTYESGLNVSVRTKRHKDAADSFVVWKNK